jgi:predicted RNA polymerase sigma factor
MAVSSREAQVLSQLAYLYLLQGYGERAMTLYAGLLVLQPGEVRHLRGLALSCSRAGLHEKGLAALDQLALRGAVDTTFYSLRARILTDLGRDAEARAAMRTCLQLKAGAQAKPAKPSTRSSRS